MPAANLNVYTATVSRQKSISSIFFDRKYYGIWETDDATSCMYVQGYMPDVKGNIPSLPQ